MKKSKKKKKTKKSLEDAAPIPLDSDMEGENVDNEEEMVGNQEWGKKKDYYNADYVDEDWDSKFYYSCIFVIRFKIIDFNLTRC